MIFIGSTNTIFNKIIQKTKGEGIEFEHHHWFITFIMLVGVITYL